MKRLCSFAVLMALCSSAYAGGSISFTVGGHRVHIESSRHCRSTSCASVSISGVNERRSRAITDREEVTPVRTGATGVAGRFAPTAGAHRAGPAIVALPPPFYRRPLDTPLSPTSAAPPPVKGPIPVRPPAPVAKWSKPCSLRRSRARLASSRRRAGRFCRSATGRPKARERCGSRNAVTRCAAMCSAPRTTRARRS